MPKVDPAAPALPRFVGSDYPAAFAAPLARLRTVKLAALEDFGVALVTVAPGEMSSRRHWHPHDDEFLWMIAGTLTLVEEGMRTPLEAGDCAIFPKAAANGHHLVNEGAVEASCIVVGANKGGTVYPDDDLHEAGPDAGYTREDGTRW